jgi:hypothetical protein
MVSADSGIRPRAGDGGRGIVTDALQLGDPFPAGRQRRLCLLPLARGAGERILVAAQDLARGGQLERRGGFGLQPVLHPAGGFLGLRDPGVILGGPGELAGGPVLGLAGPLGSRLERRLRSGGPS